MVIKLEAFPPDFLHPNWPTIIIVIYLIYLSFTIRLSIVMPLFVIKYIVSLVIEPIFILRYVSTPLADVTTQSNVEKLVIARIIPTPIVFIGDTFL